MEIGEWSATSWPSVDLQQGVRHRFKAGGRGKASKLLKIYYKFKKFIDFL